MTTDTLQKGQAAEGEATWELRLYVAGQSPKSLRATENLHRICKQELDGDYRIEMIDLLVDPQRAKGDQIIAVPTLVRQLPEPIRKIIGDLSDTAQVLVALQVIPRRRMALAPTLPGSDPPEGGPSS